ncbi:MAG: Gldg family protein [Alphaproteobacteria bacterium]
MGFFSSMDRGRLTWIGIGLAIVLFFSLNLLARNVFTSTRLDLTSDGLYTLSDGTKDLLATVDEPIDLRFYYSDKLDDVGAYFSTHAGRVRELLAEYQRLSGGKIRIERLDPEPFSKEEDLAVAEGVRGLPISNSGDLAYFGISGRNTTDDTEVVAYLAPERADFLEYDLTRMIYDLGHPEKPVVGVLGDLPLMGSQFNQGQPWLVLETMFQFFDMRFLGGNHEKIPDEIDVLMLAQPQNLDQPSLYAIDQFVMKGGRVFAMVDPFAESMVNGANQFTPQGGDAVQALEPLFKAWGVEIADGKVIADAVTAQQVGARINGRQAVVQYLPWLGLGEQNFSDGDVITAQLERVTLNSAGSIRAREGATTAIERLLTSSNQAMEIDAEPLKIAPDPAKLIAEFQPSGEIYTLAAKVTGPVKSAFPDGPPEGADEELAKNHMAEAKEPLSLVLVADADMLHDQNWVRQQDLLGQRVNLPIANNADFAVNALELLSGSQSLIGLRSRGLSVRPFTVVEQMAQEAEFKYRAKEQELLAKIDDTQKNIQKLQDEEQQSGVILTAEQQTEIENFRAEMIGLRQELRGVQRSLRQDVETLATRLKFLNIWAVPVVIALFAIGLAFFRQMRTWRFAARPSE